MSPLVHGESVDDGPHGSLDAMTTSESPPAPEPDDGVDVSLIRWMLSLTPDERLAVLQAFVDSVTELTAAAPSVHATPAT